MKILVLDNYDSFTYNLVHIIRELGYSDDMEIYRNDKINLSEIAEYDKILLSPGPGIPSEAGIMLELIDRYGSEKSILGICLGHQGIAEVYGANLYNMARVRHGVDTQVSIVGNHDYLYRDIPDHFRVGLYHSWAIDQKTISGPLAINAMSTENVIMGIHHTEYDVVGLQFHPESIITENGIQILKNWLESDR